MRPDSFDIFIKYVKGVVFTDRSVNPNSDQFFVDSLIRMMNTINNNYRALEDDILEIKGSVNPESREIFNAMLDDGLNKLRKLEFHSNYNIEKIKNWFNQFEISEQQFMTWHDLIDNENDLYNILDTHISWLNPNMDPDPNEYSFLGRYDSYEVQAIHSFFADYIKDSYVKELMVFLEGQKYFINYNSTIQNYPFRLPEKFENFKIYIDKYILDPYPDYSYLFQRLKEENLIEHITHLDFMNWLKEMEFIADNIYQKFYENKNFSSFKKSSTPIRDINFNNTFDIK